MKLNLVLPKGEMMILLVICHAFSQSIWMVIIWSNLFLLRTAVSVSDGAHGQKYLQKIYPFEIST